MFKLTTDLLRAAGSFFHHIQYILPLSLTQWCWDRVAFWLHSHHGAILHALVQTAAANRAIPNLAWGPRITLIICAHWIHQSKVNTLMIWQFISLVVKCSKAQSMSYSYSRTFSSQRHVIILSLTTAILSNTVRGVSTVQDGSTAAYTLLSDEGAGALFIVLSVETGAAGAGAHTWLILLTRGTS